MTRLDHVVRIIITWSEWNYRVSRNYEQQKWYSGSRQSVFLSEISYYAKRNSSLSKLGISFLFDKLNSATAAFKALPDVHNPVSSSSETDGSMHFQ